MFFNDFQRRVIALSNFPPIISPIDSGYSFAIGVRLAAQDLFEPLGSAPFAKVHRSIVMNLRALSEGP